MAKDTVEGGNRKAELGKQCSASVSLAGKRLERLPKYFLLGGTSGRQSRLYTDGTTYESLV
jgi:hypothetical protein